MADSNSNSSGSSSAEHSGSGHSTRKIPRKSKAVATDSPALNSSSSSFTPKGIAKPKTKDGRVPGGNFYNLVKCDVDRETAARAVAMVVRAASKRGYVSLCTEFASLLRDKERLEIERNMIELELLAQKGKRTAKSQQCASCSSSESGSGGSGSSITRGTQTKPITLLDSSTSSVRSSSSSRNSCADACVSTDDFTHLNDKGCGPTEKKSAVDEELRKAKGCISKLEYQLYSLKAENQALKTQLRHSQKSASKVSHLGLIENQSQNKVIKGSKLDKDVKSSESCEGSPTLKGTIKKEKAQSFSSNLMKDQNPNSDQSCSIKSCVKHRLRNGFGQSTPSKVHPMASSETPQLLCAESKAQSTGNHLVPLQLNKYQSSYDKKPLEQLPKVLPKLGDFVVVQGDIKGFVNYIGPVKGGNSDYYVGIHLHSPVGNNNGTLDGVRYFSCPPNYGAFVALQDITQVIPKSSAKEMLSVDNMPYQPKIELNRSNCVEKSGNSQFSQDQEERQSIKIAA